MKTLEISEATGPLSEYARSARKEPLLVTLKGKPFATLARVGPHTDLENLTVTTDPRFQAIMERSEERYRREGGLTSDEVRERFGLPRRAGPSKRRKRRKTR